MIYQALLFAPSLRYVLSNESGSSPFYKSFLTGQANITKSLLQEGKTWQSNSRNTELHIYKALKGFALDSGVLVIHQQQQCKLLGPKTTLLLSSQTWNNNISSSSTDTVGIFFHTCGTVFISIFERRTLASSSKVFISLLAIPQTFGQSIRADIEAFKHSSITLNDSPCQPPG